MEIKRIFIFALILRLIIAPIFYHPDIKSQNFHFQFLSQRHLNIYEYIYKNKKLLPYQDTFNYPPLTYITFGLEQIVLKPILPSDFTLWINDWGGEQNKYPNIFYYMLILKLPYILFDLGIGYFLYKIYNQKILKIWLFNPLSLYLIYVLANFDIIPVFLTVLAYYFLKNNQSKKSFIFLGLATALKLYPLLFLPFFLFYQKTNIKKLFINTIIFIIPSLVSVFPYLYNSYFLQSFSGSGLTQKILENKIFKIPIYPFFYLLVLVKYYLSKVKNIEKSILFIFLGFFTFVNFHPQWLLWFLPFIISPILKSRRQIFLMALFLTFSIIYVLLIDDRYLFWGHLIPINSYFIQISHPHLILLQRFNLIPELIQNYIKYCLTFILILFLPKLNEK